MELPFWYRNGNRVFLRLNTRTTIEDTASNFQFIVRDLEYALDVGWRGLRGRVSGGPMTVIVGQRGKEFVDVDGQPWLRYVAFGLESAAFRPDPTGRSRAPAALEWRFLIGPVVEQREVDADAYLRGRLRWQPGTDRMFGIDLATEALWDRDDVHGDLLIGPSLAFGDAEGRRAVFFAHYQWSDNPLGLREDTLLLGFDLSEGGMPGGRSSSFLPRLDGKAAAGVGAESRLSAELRLVALTPEFGPHLRLHLFVDANALTADDTGELYYRYDLGLEHVMGGTVLGAYFYHRSNHALAEPIPGIKAVNVFELGYQTDGWWQVGRRELRHAWGRIEGAVRLGYLISSDFGEDTRWNVRAGSRWSAPLSVAGWGLYLKAALDRGDAERETFALGFASQLLEVQVEYRQDEQYFGADRTALLWTAAYGF
jgi:hypothetical protein